MQCGKDGTFSIFYCKTFLHRFAIVLQCFCFKVGICHTVFSFLLLPLKEDSGFSPWSTWSPCTKTCTDVQSPAVKSRHRSCVRPPCSGNSHQDKPCNLPQCPGMKITSIIFTFLSFHLLLNHLSFLV